MDWGTNYTYCIVWLYISISRWILEWHAYTHFSFIYWHWKCLVVTESLLFQYPRPNFKFLSCNNAHPCLMEPCHQQTILLLMSCGPFTIFSLPTPIYELWPSVYFICSMIKILFFFFFSPYRCFKASCNFYSSRSWKNQRSMAVVTLPHQKTQRGRQLPPLAPLQLLFRIVVVMERLKRLTQIKSAKGRADVECCTVQITER